MEIAHVEAFLTLCEELHFGRASQRLHVSQPMVSRRIAALEREIGGTLFERTSRRARLTPLGEQLHARLRPPFAQLLDAIASAQSSAHGLTGVLRLGFTQTTPSEPLTRLVDAFEARHPDCKVALREHALNGDDWDLWGPLRRGESDALFYINAVRAPDEADLTAGPAVQRMDRVVLVSRGHRLARRESISIEELGDEHAFQPPASLPASVMDTLVPPSTPSGRPIARSEPVQSMLEAMSLVARGRAVHITGAGMALARRSDIIAVPLTGLPPLHLAPIWCRAHHNAKINALAHIARSLTPSNQRHTATPDTPPTHPPARTRSS